MFWFNTKRKKIYLQTNLKYEKKSYSLITSVSIRRLPGDGEHIFFLLNNIVN